MAQPTNLELVTLFPDNLEDRLDADTEIWVMTTKMLVKKGTDVEQQTADLVQGRYAENPRGTSQNTLAVTFTDFTKVS